MYLNGMNLKRGLQVFQRKMKEGAYKKDKLDKERIKRLEKIGFTWDLRMTKTH